MLDVLYVQRDWFVQHRTEAAYRRAMKPTCQERTHTLHRHRTECTHTPWLLLHQGQGVQYLPGRAPHRHLPPPPIHERTKRESMTLPPEWTKGEAPPPHLFLTMGPHNGGGGLMSLRDTGQICELAFV